MRASAPTGGRRPGRGDGGAGLAELVVVMAVSSLLLVVLAGVYVSSLRTTSTVTAKVSATADVAHATEVVARRLRVAVAPGPTTPALASMAPDRLSFYASIATSPTAVVDPVPTLVTYEYSTSRGCLTETTTPGQGTAAPYSYPSSAAVTTCLVRGTVTGGDVAMFTYFGSPDLASTTTTAVAADVRAVGVSLAVTQTSGAASATTRDGSRVVLDNVLSTSSGA